MLLGISLDVPREVHDFVRGMQGEFRDRFGLKNGLLQPPHITLKRPFERDDSDPFENFLSEYVRTLARIPIDIQGIDFFPEGVIFLKVIESPELVTVRHEVVMHLEEKLGVPRDPLEMKGFKFHLTLAYGDVTPPVLERIRTEYGGRPVTFQFRAQSISLLRNTGSEWLATKIYLISDRPENPK